MTESDIAAIRDALAAGPTSGPWSFTDKAGNGIATVACVEAFAIGHDYGSPGMACYDFHAKGSVDAAYIAACHPERIARLLDALESAQKDAALVRAQALEEAASVAESTICDVHLPTGVRIYGTKAAAAIRALPPLG